ncbi:MAG: tRNA epoxyqueuosine(34) reductase QueG [Nitrospirota bacterium]|nr:tRNA epoxyqueuosine(34) reductase QueG [Nitrospirota bacterium]
MTVPPQTVTLAERIKQEAQRLGFDAVGISRIDGSPQPSVLDDRPRPFHQLLYDRLCAWIERGYHGAMAWMERAPHRRADPGSVLPGCRSIISVGMNYGTGHRADESPGHGRIARYAWGRDYHGILQAKLEQLEALIRTLAPNACTRWYVDTGPVMEKAWAQQAGLGWIGKHSNLVSARYGSWLLLGEVLTTLELEPDEPGTDLCGTCQLCVRACPTGAITEPYVVDARRCISYLTIELHKPGDEIPVELERTLGNRIFGCDDCLDACPYNLAAQPTQESAFQPSPLTLAPSLSTLETMSERTFQDTFRLSAIRRAKYSGLLRNVRIARRNAQSPSHSPSDRPFSANMS